jgi:hypothetical protein
VVKILVGLAVAFLLGGLYTLTIATGGVGLIGAACFLGLCARMVQASQQHEKLIYTLWRQTDHLADIAAAQPRLQE